MFSWMFLLFFICAISVVSPTPSPDAESRLLMDLVNKTSAFHKHSPPTHNGPVIVEVIFELLRFDFKDEAKGLTSIHANINSYWTDTRLSWDPLDYDGAEYTLLPLDDVWLPSITTHSGHVINEESEPRSNADVNFAGNVSFYNYKNIESICRLDLRYFPYDKQVCTMTFASATHAVDKIKLIPIADDLRFFYKKEGGDFKITKLEGGENEFGEKMFGWQNIDFNIHMERISSAYSVKLVLPAVVTGFLILMTFLLPPTSQEKVNLAGLIFVSLILQLVNLQDLVPGSGHTMMGDFLAFSLCMDFFAIIVAVLSYYQHGKESKMNANESKSDELPMPNWCQGVMKALRFLDIIFFVIFLIVYIIGLVAILGQRG